MRKKVGFLFLLALMVGRADGTGISTLASLVPLINGEQVAAAVLMLMFTAFLALLIDSAQFHAEDFATVCWVCGGTGFVPRPTFLLDGIEGCYSCMHCDLGKVKQFHV